VVGSKQFYIHYHQIDNNRVLQGKRIFELINFSWESPYHIVHLDRFSGALTIPKETFHRSYSGEEGSILINQAIRDPIFNPETEFVSVSAANHSQLYHVLMNEAPVFHI
jgi:hypothetical protein